jgi:hypothetical protein
MNRRNFLQLGAMATTGALFAKSLLSVSASAADAGKKITDKNIMSDGMPATIANYCSTPDKQPNKACPDWKDKPGHCETCMFFNTDNSITDFSGSKAHKAGKYAHCSLLTDPSKPQFVSIKGWCSTYTKKA